MNSLLKISKLDYVFLIVNRFHERCDKYRDNRFVGICGERGRWRINQPPAICSLFMKSPSFIHRFLRVLAHSESFRHRFLCLQPIPTEQASKNRQIHQYSTSSRRPLHRLYL